MIDAIGKNVNAYAYKPQVKSDKVNFTAQSDEFVKQDDNKEEKKGLSKKAKWGIAGGIGVAALIAFYIAKGKFTEAKKLAESIDFKPAQTIEEAIEFGKKHLGIRSYTGFEAKDIEVINWVNEGLVNTSNKMKGNLRMPKDIVYTDKLGENTLAGVITNGKYQGRFGVNKKIFDNIDKSIENSIDSMEQVIRFLKKDNGKWAFHKHSVIAEDDAQEFAKQFVKYKEGNFTFKQKLDFYASLDVLHNRINSYNEVPFNTIKQLLKQENVKKFCEDNNILTDLEKIKLLSNQEQHNLIQSMQNKGVVFHIGFDIKSMSAFDTIYHEMGHIQDMTPRCLTTDKYKFEYSKYSDELKAWVDNQENMQIANRVSEYASHGPGEFIAETFARMIQGNKLPDEVVALYKKLKGPAVPGY